MNIILRILGKKIEHGGQTYIQYPIHGWKGKVCEYLTTKNFEKKHQDTPKRTINQLADYLVEIEPFLKEKKLAFIIDVQKGKMVELQITHPVALFDITQDKQYMNFGYVVHWNFDPTNATVEDYAQLERFKKMNSFNDFIHHKYMEDVECFSYDCKESIPKTVEIVKQILSETFKDDPETKYYFLGSDNGSIE